MSDTSAREELCGATPVMGSTRRCIIPATEAERRRLERLVQKGNYVAPVRGIFAPTNEWDSLDKVERAGHIIRALALVHPAWVFCLFSAAVIHGLEVGRDSALPVCVRVPRRGHTRSAGLIRRVVMPSAEFCQVDGAKVTPLVQTVADCLCQLPFPRALAIADSALRVFSMSKDELWAEIAGRQEGPARSIAEAAISFADARSANGGESVARAVMIEEGFMVPELQLFMEDPLEVGRGHYVGYAWNLTDGTRVVGELDGKDKYALPEMTGDRDVLEVLGDERRRESCITAGGMRVLRFSFSDVMNRPKFVRMLELYGIPRGASRIMSAYGGEVW